MKLGLGTVQFGMNYGISNKNGQPSPSEISAILKLAGENGVELLDTSSLYATSERAIGELLPQDTSFKIVTKGLAEDLRGSLKRSLGILGVKQVYGFLIHDPEKMSQRAFNDLHEVKEEGLVQKIGVSVYSGEQIDRALSMGEVDLVQLPLNLLDQRLIRSGHLAKLKEKGVEVHARSIFLQGLLLIPPATLPEKFASIRSHLIKVEKDFKAHGLTIFEGALGFVESLTEVDRVIAGVTSSQELQEIVTAFIKLKIHKAEILKIAETCQIQDEKILNPSLWKTA